MTAQLKTSAPWESGTIWIWNLASYFYPSPNCDLLKQSNICCSFPMSLWIAEGCLLAWGWGLNIYPEKPAFKLPVSSFFYDCCHMQCHGDISGNVGRIWVMTKKNTSGNWKDWVKDHTKEHTFLLSLAELYACVHHLLWDVFLSGPAGPAHYAFQQVYRFV